MVRDMHRRARVSRAVLGAVLVVVVAGCGSDGTTEDGPSKATVACRGQWKDLGKQVQGNDEKTNPSALAARWNSVVATIEYYASSAKASGCDEAIDHQKEAISSLTEFGTKLAPYDMELRLEQVRDAAETYAAGPRPTPSPSPTPKDKKKKKHAKKPKAPPLPPAPATIAATLKTLIAQAPLATAQQGPGWQQARVVELSDPAAVAKTVKDLAFLSTESAAWRTCQAGLTQIKVALAAAAK
jgi:hypothetical protein